MCLSHHSGNIRNKVSCKGSISKECDLKVDGIKQDNIFYESYIILI